MSKILRNFQLITYSLLLIAFFSGCATAPTRGYTYRAEETVTIRGSKYVSVKLVSQVLNADYHFDYITRKATLSKGAKTARIMDNSSVVLLNNNLRTMPGAAIFRQGTLLIPQSFARGSLNPFFGEEYIEKAIISSDISNPIKCVIIDPGHGGKDPGATGRAGLKEKDAVLDIAKRLKRYLDDAGIKVVLTRDSDKFISLAQRARVANTKEQEGTFFISIHANASRSRWVSGVEVFYLAESVDDNQRSLAASQNYRPNLKEAYSGKYTSAIIWDLIFTERRRESKQLASAIGNSLCKVLYQKNRGVKQARFYVLKANTPAILVEVGFISNAKEEKRLRDSSYRNKIARGVAEGIFQYNRLFNYQRTARY